MYSSDYITLMGGREPSRPDSPVQKSCSGIGVYRMKTLKLLSLPLLIVFVLQGLVTATPSAQDPNPARTGTDGLPWWNDRVFYEVFVRSFEDSDGDGNGDLQGLISKLDYLNDGDPATSSDLGVTGLWLMPIMQSPSYHGYDVTDYMQVESDYGTNEDFKQLVAEAHRRGIAVIVDLVINHTSREHPWFEESRNPASERADWYRWSPDKPRGTGPWGQQVWHDGGGRYYYGVFWEGMPDLNLTNPEVTQAVYGIADFWLKDMGVDGFRMDAVRYFVEDENKLASADGSFAWLGDWNAHLNSFNRNALTVGEIWASSFEVTDYVPDSVDIAFEFDLALAMLQSAKSGRSSALLTMMERALELYPQGQFASFLTNHDQNRVMNELRENVDKARIAASVLLTAPGVPFLYYGEEVGMIGAKPDECIRTPMQWDSSERQASFTADKKCKVNTEQFNVAAQTDDPNSLLSHYRTLIHLRNAHPALRAGDMTPVESSSRKLYSFVCHTTDEALLIVMNLSDDVVSDYTLTLAQGPFRSASEIEVLLGDSAVSVPDFNSDGGFDAYVPLPELPPFSTMVMKLG